MQRLAILIPVFNGIEYTRKCLSELEKILSASPTIPLHVFIVVIDDGSTDGTSEEVSATFPNVILLKGDGNLWWSGAMNLGARYALEQLKVDFILLWNNDIAVVGNYFQALLKLVIANDQSVVYGSKIYSSVEKKIIWSMGGRFNPKSGNFFMTGYNQIDSEEYEKEHPADWLPGMGTLFPAKAIRDVGYWDNLHFPHYHGDSDYTYRAKLKGFSIVVSPELCLYNDTTHSGSKQKNSFGDLIRSFSDRKSLYNIRVNLAFFRLYATSIWAYSYLLKSYFRYIGGFIKWKIFGIFGGKRLSNV